MVRSGAGVRDRPALEPPPLAAELALELGEQSGLAQTSLADDEREVGLTALSAAGGPLELAELGLAADERGESTVETARLPDRRVRRRHLVDRHRARLALDDLGAERTGDERVTHERVRVRSDQDTLRRRQRLQPRGQVRGVAHRGVLGLVLVAHAREHAETGVHPTAHRDPEAVAAEQPSRVLGCRIADRERGEHGPLGVVLVRGGGAEQRQDPIAHEPRYRALVARDRIDHEADDAVHDLGPLLRVDPLGERRRTDDVGEEDAHQTAFGGAGRCGSKQRSAVVAEPRSSRVLRLTGGAGHVVPPVLEVLAIGSRVRADDSEGLAPRDGRRRRALGCGCMRVADEVGLQRGTLASQRHATATTPRTLGIRHRNLSHERSP